VSNQKPYCAIPNDSTKILLEDRFITACLRSRKLLDAPFPALLTDKASTYPQNPNRSETGMSISKRRCALWVGRWTCSDRCLCYGRGSSYPHTIVTYNESVRITQGYIEL